LHGSLVAFFALVNVLQCRMALEPDTAPLWAASGDMGPQRRTYHGAHWYIAWQFERDMRRMGDPGYIVASQTWIPGMRMLSAVTMCLIVTYQHYDGLTTSPASELQRVIDLGQAGAITQCQFDRAMRQLVG